MGEWNLDARWLEANTGKKENLWTVENTNPNLPEYLYPFIGNGYIGLRIPTEGTLDLLSDPRTIVASVFTNGERLRPPKWFGLGYYNGSNWYSRDIGTHQYLQTLNFKDSILTTTDEWTDGDKTSIVQITTFVSRAVRYLGVIEFKLKPEFTGTVKFRDELTAVALPPTELVNTGQKDIHTVTIKYPQVKVIAVSATKVTFSKNIRPTITYEKTDKGSIRYISFPVEKGKEYTILKYGAVCTSADETNPGLYVTRLLNKLKFTDYQKIVSLHRQEWNELWQSNVIVENHRVQKLIHAGLYLLYANFRKDVLMSSGSNSLSIECNMWGGRVFWDADLWIYPGLLLLRPELAKSIVEYRYRTLRGALINAKKAGWKGALFAWESAATGEERTPGVPVNEQRHVNNDICLSQWQYYLVTGDKKYLRDKAVPVIFKSAEFWASRVIFNREKDRYELHKIVCADEFAVHKNNNTLTNYGAVVNLQTAVKIAKLLGKKFPIKWTDIIDKMYYPYDLENDVYLEHDTYSGELIKQADTVLIIYPYQKPMDRVLQKRIVDFYTPKLPESHIMMSSAIHSVIYSQLNETEKAYVTFLDLLPHFLFPYLVPSEAPDNGCTPFITGIGGFMQSLINGFAGIRITEAGLTVTPHLPKGWNKLLITGMQYRNVRFDLNITQSGGTVFLSNLSSRKSKLNVFTSDGKFVKIK